MVLITFSGIGLNSFGGSIMQVRKISAAASLVVAGLMAGSSMAATQTWSATAATSAWATGTNWAGGAAPGGTNAGTNNATNADSAVFNTAVTGGGIGDTANPILFDAGSVRLIRNVIFDTGAGSFHLGAAGGDALTLSSPTAGSTLGAIIMNAGVTNSQFIDGVIRYRSNSSTQANMVFENNSTTTGATLNFTNSTLDITNRNGRPGSLILQGSNTGDNLIASNITDTFGSNQNIATITKNGTGRWILRGANTFTTNGTNINQGIQINGGTLVAQNNNALGSAASGANGHQVSINNTGTLEINDSSVNGSITLLDGIIVNLNNGGTLSNVGTNTIHSTLRVGGATPAAGIVASINQGSGILNLGSAANDVTGGAADSVVNVTGSGALNLTQAGNYAGSWSFNSGTTTLGAGTATALGSNPGANFGGGTLVLNDNATSIKYLSGSTGTLTNNGTTATTVTINQATNTSFGGSITDGSGGSIAVVKSGVGSLTLGGSSSYTGATTINGGTLRVNGALTNSAVTVNTSGVIGGSGTIGGGATVASGGKIEAGASALTVGTLNLSTLNMQSGATGAFDFNLSNNDIVNVTTAGGLTLNGNGFQLFAEGTTDGFDPGASGSYTLFDYTGAAPSLTGLSILNPVAGYSYSFTNDAINTLVKVQLTATGTLASWANTGSGTQDWTVGANWTTNPTVPNAVGDVARFLGAATGATTVELNGSKTVGAVFFNNANSYTIAQGSGGSLVFDVGGSGAGITNQSGSHGISAPITIADTGGLVINGLVGTTTTISGAITGTSGITKSGTGTLILSSASNNYGNTTVNSGTLEFVSGALGTLPGKTITLDNSTLRFATGNTQDISAATVTIGASGATLDTNGNSVSLANSIGNGGLGGLTKAGAGTLTVAASNNYSGTTAINSGTLVISANDSLGVPSAGAGVTINGGTLQTTATMTFDNAGSNQRAFTVGASGATISTAASTVATITGTVSGAGSLTKSGAGDLDISSDNSATFSGPVTINGGILRLQNGNAIAGSVLNYNNAGGTLAFGPAVTAATVRSINGNQNIVLTNDAAGAVALSFGSDNTAWNYTGSFSGLGSIVKQGTGLLTLSGTSNIGGSVTLQTFGGNIEIPTGASLTASSLQSSNVGAASTFLVSGGTVVANTATSNFLNGGGGGGGNGSLTMTGGSVTLADVNLATDNNNQNILMSITGGTLNMANLTTGRSGTTVTAEPVAGATTYGPYINGASAIVNISGNLGIGQGALANSNASMRMDAGTVNVTGVVTIGNNNGGRWSALDINGGVFNNANAAGLTFGHGSGASNGTFIVRGTGVANVEKIDFGTLANQSFGTVQVITGGTLNVGAGGIAQTNLSGTGVVRLTGTLTTAADLTPAVALNLNGAAGVQGTLQASDALNVPHNITLDKPTYGTGGLIKTGGGSLTINGHSSYTGPITNNAGTMTLNSPNVAAANVTLTDTLAGLNTIIVNDTSGLTVGQQLTGTGTGLPEGTVITSIVDGTTLTISNNATATLTAGAVALSALGSSPVGLGTPVVTNNATLNLPVSATVASLVGTGTTNVSAGSLNIASGRIQQNTLNTSAGTVVTVAANGSATGVSVINNLNLNATSKLELHNNDLVVDYGANPTEYTNVVNHVKNGLALLGGAATSGIGSFEVDNQTVGGTMLAVVDDGDPNIGGAITELSGLLIPNPTSSVLVKYTWFGDSNLDGIVDGSDYALIDTGFTAGGALGGWVFGDYDYSGTVDGSDYALIDTGFISQTGALPEPTTLGLLGLGAMGMLRRRRQA